MRYPPIAAGGEYLQMWLVTAKIMIK